jgi:hypothetical protein
MIVLKCAICRGTFAPQPCEITDEATGRTVIRYRLTCPQCGDTIGSPEQDLAWKSKHCHRAARDRPRKR